MKRKYKFRWKDMAGYIGVTSQCVDSYACGRAHPQIMKFYVLCEYIAKYTNQPTNNIIILGMDAIRKDTKEKKK